MGADRIASRREGLIEAEVDGELLGLHIDNGYCYGFNPTATRIWALIETPRTVTQLCETLSEEFEVTPADARPDVEALLEELQREGLVDLAPA
ncbi:PqqD family protein [Sphingomonas sp.]|uniref:PqqD family protein n=1 Tax=Sphingomonas sp. TaxID=28214 RepID=UPI002DD621EE|nr:PqqD family protein [Sphingomonas sp.]